MGYRITATNYDKPDYVEWEMVKGDQSYEVQLDMAGGKASKIDVTSNMWQADATDRALEAVAPTHPIRTDAAHWSTA